MEASIEEKKAEKYAKTFVQNMLNKTIIKSLDENSLITFNIQKEDIPLILNYIKKMDVVSLFFIKIIIIIVYKMKKKYYLFNIV